MHKIDDYIIGNNFNLFRLVLYVLCIEFKQLLCDTVILK